MGAISRGLRNISRNKPRTFAVTIILALSLGIFVGMIQATSSIETQTRNLTSVIETTIEVRNAGATGMGAGVELIPESDVEKIEGISNIVLIEKQLFIRKVYSQYFPSISVIVGNEPGKPLRVATHGEPAIVRIIAGRNLQVKDAGKNVAVVGKIYAENRGLEVGSTTTLNGTDVKVIGIFSSGFSFGDNQVFLPLDAAQKIYNQEGLITIIWVTVDSVENVEQVRNDIQAVYGDSRDVLTAEAKTRLIAQSFSQIVALGRAGAILSVIIGGTVVLFTMILITNERIREMGILKAIGASNGDVAKQFVAEVLALTLIGGLLGLLFFAVAGPPLTNTFLGLTPSATQSNTEMGQAPATALLDLSLTYNLNLATVSLVFGLIFFLGVVGSLYPVIRAVKMKPAVAMRHE